MEINREAQALADATWRALDQPGGEEILERMCAGQMSVLDGLVALAILSGNYERIPSRHDRREDRSLATLALPPEDLQAAHHVATEGRWARMSGERSILERSRALEDQPPRIREVAAALLADRDPWGPEGPQNATDWDECAAAWRAIAQGAVDRIETLEAFVRDVAAEPFYGGTPDCSDRARRLLGGQ